jgi:hypothetical protein
VAPLQVGFVVEKDDENVEEDDEKPSQDPVFSRDFTC